MIVKIIGFIFLGIILVLIIKGASYNYGKMALLKIGLVVKCYKNRDYYDDNLLVEVKER